MVLPSRPPPPHTHTPFCFSHSSSPLFHRSPGGRFLLADLFLERKEMCVAVEFSPAFPPPFLLFCQPHPLTNKPPTLKAVRWTQLLYTGSLLFSEWRSWSHRLTSCDSLLLAFLSAFDCCVTLPKNPLASQALPLACFTTWASWPDWEISRLWCSVPLGDLPVW